MRHESILNEIREISKLMGISNPEMPYKQFENAAPAFDSTECTLIKANNIDAMMWLQDKVLVDFCYIDPPYNTGGDFIYSDSRKVMSPGLWGRHHDWLAFMLPRFVLAKNLMRDTGIIAVSIDDYEYAHLKILMDCIFGDTAYIATLVVCRSKNGKGSSAVAVNHEYVLIYGKSSKAKLAGIEDKNISAYDKEDEHGRYKVDGLFRKKGDASKREDRPNMFYPLYYSSDGRVYTEKLSDDLQVSWPVDSSGVERRWLWGPDKAKAEAWKLYASKNGVIYVKNYHTQDKRVKIRSILDGLGYLTEKATNEIKEIYGEKVFETPKPLQLIKDLVSCCSFDDAIVLDFFAGTGTTAHAVFEINKTSNSRRKTILIEHNHHIDEAHIAKKYGFNFTSEITEFRLNKIQKTNPEFVFSAVGLDQAT